MNLQLSLKRKWFELTKDGIKTEDYREITPYWAKRLFLYQNEKLGKNLHKDEIVWLCNDLKKGIDVDDIKFQVDNWYGSFNKFDKTLLTLGYPSKSFTSRIIQFEHLGIEIREGNPDWGAEPGKLYFVIKHGKIIS